MCESRVDYAPKVRARLTKYSALASCKKKIHIVYRFRWIYRDGDTKIQK